MGNPRLPDEVKKKRGTFQKCRSNPDAPEPIAGRPEPPDDLDNAELAAFWSLVEAAEDLGVCDPRNHHLFAIWARQYPRFVKLSKAVKEEGDTLRLEAANGGEKVMRNPDSVALDACGRELKAILVEFGLTPAAMGRVAAKKKGDKGKHDPWEEYGFGKESN